MTQLRLEIIRRVAFGLIYFILIMTPSGKMAAQNVEAYMVLPSTGYLIMGDTVAINIVVDTHGSEITGFDFYLTIDPAIFKPVFTDGRPFAIGNFLAGGNPAQYLNDTHDDIWNDPFVNLNSFPDFQLDYAAQTGPAVNGIRPTAKGNGTAAIFQVEIVGVDASGVSTITFDDQRAGPGDRDRETRYHHMVSDVQSAAHDFARLTDLDVTISGISIKPVIPDTVIVPGSTLTFDLINYFRSNIVDSSTARWSIISSDPASLPTGASFSVSPTTGANPQFTLLTAASNHFKFTALVGVEGDFLIPVPPVTFTDTQTVIIIVDNVPVFDQPMPASFSFNEDEQLRIRGRSNIFTDPDDSGTDLVVLLEPDSPVSLIYTATDSMIFSAPPDYFGTYQARLFVTDALGQSADSLITIDVVAVNDTPSIAIDSISTLLVIHRGISDTVILTGTYADVDDSIANLTLSFSFLDSISDLQYLDAAVVNDLLFVRTTDSISYRDIDLEITVTDTAGATASDTIVVSIRSWPPELDTLSTIIVLAGTPLEILLDTIVTDLDTPDSLLSWNFRALSMIDSTIDNSVTFTHDTQARIVTIDAPTGYAASDFLVINVIDDNNNRDSTYVRMIIFDSFYPVIFPIQPDTIFMNRITQTIDLDDYVADPLYQVETLEWSFFGGDSLASIQIDPISHKLTLTTRQYYFGNDTISLVVENPDGLADSALYVLRIVPEFDNAPVWLALSRTQVVYPDTQNVFALRDAVKDDYDDFDDLTINLVSNSDPFKPLEIFYDSISTQVRITVPAAGIYTTWFYYTAEDRERQQSQSDTVWVEVRDSYAPIWSELKVIRFFTTETYSDTLSRHVRDDDTDTGALQFRLSTGSNFFTIKFDTATTVFTLTPSGLAGGKGDMLVEAEDPEGNISGARFIVDVRQQRDEDPPDASLNYFFNPASRRWINFVVVADSTTNQLGSSLTFQNQAKNLNFVLSDDQGSAYSWIAPYLFEIAGVYELKVSLSDLSKNTTHLSKNIGMVFSKALGGTIFSPDSTISVHYPSGVAQEGDMLLVIFEQTDGITGPGLLKNTLVDTWEIAASGKRPFLTRLRYEDQDAADNYYAFYQLDVAGPIRLETFRTGAGYFEASVNTGSKVFFSKSDIPAERANILPEQYLIAYPNPFNANLQIKFNIPFAGRARMAIYNILGREIYSTPQKIYSPGVYSLSWEGIDLSGRSVASGVYLVLIQHEGSNSRIRKVVMVK